MPETPTVSVIIPAYQVSQYIRETLDSVLAQTYSDYEIVVVNDGSPDTSQFEDILRPYMDKLTYVKQDNHGPSYARNTGIRRAAGRYVAFLDGDDLWRPDFLARQMALLNKNPRLDLVYSDTLFFGSDLLEGRTAMEFWPSQGKVTLEALIEQRCTVFTSTVVARKEAVVEAGLFDVNITWGEDFDLWLRLALLGKRLDFQPEVLGKRRVRDSALSASRIEFAKSVTAVFERLLDDPRVPEHARQMAEASVRRYRYDTHLAEGGRFLDEGRYSDATQSYQAAYSLAKKPKLRILLWCLAACPPLARFGAGAWQSLLNLATRRKRRRGAPG